MLNAVNGCARLSSADTTTTPTIAKTNLLKFTLASFEISPLKPCANTNSPSVCTSSPVLNPLRLFQQIWRQETTTIDQILVPPLIQHADSLVFSAVHPRYCPLPAERHQMATPVGTSV